MEKRRVSNLKIIVADDHALFRSGVVGTLRTFPFVADIREASDGNAVIELLKKFQADLILMDISMPGMDGHTATKLIRSKNPFVKIIALTVHDDERNIMEMYKAGVNGYLLKNTDRHEIEKAIRVTMAGRSYNSSEVSHVFISNILDRGSSEGTNETLELSERELEILKLICAEMTSKEIGEKLFLSIRTIEAHRLNLMTKTNSKTILGLMKYALKNGVV